ncbi:MAG: glycosyltransferase family 4 protein [Chitinophagales bacterium]
MQTNKPNIAVLSLNSNKYSETFIHNQIKYLPAKVHCLYDGSLPKFGPNGVQFEVDEKSLSNFLFRKFTGITTVEQQQKNIEQYFIKNNIKAVVANYAITAFPIMDICQRNNIPLIVHFHGWTAYRKSLLVKHEEDYKRMFAIASAVIVVSKDMYEQLQKLGCPKEKLSIIYYGFNNEVFSYNDHSQNPPTFLSVGRFCDTKNPHLTILAFHQVLQSLPAATLNMIGGDENLLNSCIQLVKSLKIEERVSFLGIKSPEEVASAMQKAIAFVQHSATTIEGEKEGTPVSIIEAMASGLPVVATRHAGIPDVIIENESGLLCDEFDVNEMAKLMLKVATDKALNQRIGKKASVSVHTNFTMQQYIDKLWAVINDKIQKQ